jgi:hypothetical protein
MARSTSRPVAKKEKKIKTAVNLSPENIKRIGLACAVENMTQSEVIEMLCNRHLKDYVISMRGPGLGISPVPSSTSVESAKDTHEVSLSISSQG